MNCLSKHCANGSDIKAIVSFTSYPKRIEYSKRVLKSLLHQTYENYKVVLYLSEDEFTNRKEVEKEFSFASNDKFMISWVDGNIRSYKKFFYAFSNYPNDVVITVDDDVEYSETMIEELINGYRQFPDCVISRRTHLITRYEDKIDEYDQWYGECEEFVCEPRMDLYATGIGAILYPPNIFDSEVLNKDVFIGLCPYGDDIWLKIMEIRNGIKTVFVHGEEYDRPIEEVCTDGLYQHYNHGNGNDNQIKALIQRYRGDLADKIEIQNLYTNRQAETMRRNFIMEEMNNLIEIIRDNKEAYIYGAGMYGILFLNYLELVGYADRIIGFLVNDTSSNDSCIKGIPVLDYRNIQEKGANVFVALSLDKQQKVLKDLLDVGFPYKNVIRLSRNNLHVLSGQEFMGSALYWEKRYKDGGNSGSGSYNRLAEFKAEVINSFIAENKIESVIEWGCGDGNQLSMIKVKKYFGFDVSAEAIKICSKRFENDKTKKFACINENTFCLSQRADMAMSLDVLYHLVEDEIFESYMARLFESSTKYVCIYSCNYEEDIAEHVRCRKFTEYVHQNFPTWKLIGYIKNKYPYDLKDVENTSFSDFYFYEKQDI